MTLLSPLTTFSELSSKTQGAFLIRLNTKVSALLTTSIEDEITILKLPQ